MKRIMVASVGALCLLLVGCGGSGGSSSMPVQPKTYGAGDAGLVDGEPSVARFHNPVNTEIAPDGTTYVCDFDNDAIRKIDPSGHVTTLTHQDGFSRPFGITLTPQGRLFVQTDTNDTGGRDLTTGTIWQIDLTTGLATVAVRNIGRPRGMVSLIDGRLALSDIAHHTIRIFDPYNSKMVVIAGSYDQPGYVDGGKTTARFDRPYGIDRLSDGSFLVADANNNRIRRVTMAGNVTTYAGSGNRGRANGERLSAEFNDPQDVTIDKYGTIYVADTANHLVRRIYKNQIIDQVGNGVAGYREGLGTAAELFGDEGISTNGSLLMIADGNGGEDLPYNRVRRQPVETLGG